MEVLANLSGRALEAPDWRYLDLLAPESGPA